MTRQASWGRFLIFSVVRRLGSVVLTLVAIAYITSFGLLLAERGRQHLPAEPLNAAGEAAVRVVNYVVDHPATYFWDKYTLSAPDLVLSTLLRSAGLLLLSLAVAVALGVPLGVAAALARRRVGASLVLLLSVLGVSTPSFLLAMLFWVANIAVHRAFAIQVLPATGFGWDAHLVMPTLVLAARPLAQVAQVTYVSLAEVLGQDYIRTARAKGLPWPVVRNRHALRNVLIPILNALGTSLRFSLASLPVVEYFFNWPGVGQTLLEAIDLGMSTFVVDLIVSLGFFFLVVNLLIEFLYPLLDPRLRDLRQEESTERLSWRQRLHGWADSWAEWWEDLRNSIPGRRRKRPRLPPLPIDRDNRTVELRKERLLGRKELLLRATFLNPALLVGLVLVLGLVVLAGSGDRLTTANPYELHGVMVIEGKVGAPPFAPSPVFPWGTDHLGRDIQALVLTGARQTLVLAFFGMVARVVLGAFLGLLAGWWRGGWFDRLVAGAVGVWAAFPVTLFAMLLIQALGIQQGMSVFIVALAVVGWGEVAQFIRGQVIGVRAEPYIDAARSIGSRPIQTLFRHVLPHLVSPLLVLSALEMGGILMLLAELGFLNTFLGGGFRVMIAETGAMVPVIAYFSDVPEWGALLSNIRAWWRSYPWMAWYPGMAFFLAIAGFNLFAEGLRRFVREGRVNLSRLVNRYTLAAAAAGVVLLALVLRTASPIGVYQAQAVRFDAQRAMDDIRVLSSPEYAGRETGTPGADRAAAYIAERMREIGLLPGGADGSYIVPLPTPRAHLADTPRLTLLDSEGQVAQSFAYRRDYVEYTGLPAYGPGGAAMISSVQESIFGRRRGNVVGLTLGPWPNVPGMAPGMMPGMYNRIDPYGLRNYYLDHDVVIVLEAEVERVHMRGVGSVLIVGEDPLVLQRRYLFKTYSWEGSNQPVLYITPQTADRLLATAGSSLAELKRLSAGLGPAQVATTARGAMVSVEVPTSDSTEDTYYHVLGYIPGSGAEQDRTGSGLNTKALDSRVIMVSAYYDGLGVGPDGTLYPGANDNASGVAALLEMARVMVGGPFQPKKTILFVAWAGGERGESLSVSNIMGAKTGFDLLEVEAVIELSGVGAGSGTGLALGEGSSFRLVRLLQDAAGRLGVPTTTRGRTPHVGNEARPAFGGRSALSLYLSWDGSDRTAHLPGDTLQAIDPRKLEQAGRTTLLAVTVLSREVNY